jgi:hemerythrin-like domain-containing protein
MSKLTRLGGALHEEHFRIVVWISDLQNRVTGEAGERTLDPNDAEDKQALHMLIVSLDQVLLHHSFEEEVLFPLIRDRYHGDDLKDVLVGGHAAIEPIAEGLQAVIAEILREGAGNDRWLLFRMLAKDLFSEMMTHLMLEEIGIIQNLAILIDADTDQRLAQQHSAHRLLGAQAKDRPYIH